MGILSMDKMESRQSYRNFWHTDLMGTASADLPYFCFALWCSPCASYLLRKRALYDDMSSVCACMQTQHKVELDKRDGKFGPMQAPPPQQMSRFDQPVPPAVGYTPGYGAPPVYGKPAYGQPYPPQAYPQQLYPQQPYPPKY